MRAHAVGLQGPGFWLITYLSLLGVYLAAASMTSIWEPIIIIGSTAGGQRGKVYVVGDTHPAARLSLMQRRMRWAGGPLNLAVQHCKHSIAHSAPSLKGGCVRPPLPGPPLPPRAGVLVAFVFPGLLGLVMGEDLLESRAARRSRGVVGGALVFVGLLIGVCGILRVCLYRDPLLS